MKAGELEEIPWEVRISRPYLRTDQRLAVSFRVRVVAEQLNTSGPVHDLYWLVRVQDASGAWLNAEEPGHTELAQALPDAYEVEFEASALMRPGTYRAAIVLYDRATTKRNLKLHAVAVEPLQPEPLPEAFRTLPPVELLTTVTGWDAYYQPELKGRLWLPLKTKRPVEIEILVNFGTTKQYTGQLVPHYLNLERMTGMLKPLTEIQLSNGTLHVTGFDLNARKVVFEQQEVGELDWPRLREAVSALNPRVVSVDELLANKRTAAFFRDLLTERLGSRGVRRAGSGGTDSQPSPYRVFIVLSHYTLFPRGSDLTPIPAPEACDCRVYYLRFQLWRANWDELERVMKHLKPRRFEIRQARDFRQALAVILNELGKL